MATKTAKRSPLADQFLHRGAQFPERKGFREARTFFRLQKRLQLVADDVPGHKHHAAARFRAFFPQPFSDLLKAASSNVLRFKVDRPLPPEFADKARVTGRIVQLPAHDAHEIERYLAIIREAGLRVEDVEVRKADLEDVFLDVMAKHGEQVAV